MTTGYISDMRFRTHTLQGHPEHAGRLVAVHQQLEAEKLFERCVRLPADLASIKTLHAVHTPSYIAELEKTAHASKMTRFGRDTYVLPQSYEIARLAAGGTLNLVRAVMQGEVQNGFALVRPPGHHATAGQGMGFCLLNNVAIAAAQIQQQNQRVLILDYDVHHGNGTQDIFYNNPDVFYISTHQSPLYPGTGALYETGEGPGVGYTLNIPLAPGAGDKSFQLVCDEIVVPAIRRFRPQIMLVSAGFDAHWMDPLANLTVTLTGFDHMTRTLIGLANELCDGRIVFVMEGGYDLQVLSYAWVNVVRALLGDTEMVDPLRPNRLPAEPRVELLLQHIKQVHELN